nr:hypothetical protein Iba_chr01eCG0200 [Ipomoea batatas]
MSRCQTLSLIPLGNAEGFPAITRRAVLPADITRFRSSTPDLSANGLGSTSSLVTVKRVTKASVGINSNNSFTKLVALCVPTAMCNAVSETLVILAVIASGSWLKKFLALSQSPLSAALYNGRMSFINGPGSFFTLSPNSGCDEEPAILYLG